MTKIPTTPSRRKRHSPYPDIEIISSSSDDEGLLGSNPHTRYDINDSMGSNMARQSHPGELSVVLPPAVNARQRMWRDKYERQFRDSWMENPDSQHKRLDQSMMNKFIIKQEATAKNFAFNPAVAKYIRFLVYDSELETKSEELEQLAAEFNTIVQANAKVLAKLKVCSQFYLSK